MKYITRDDITEALMRLGIDEGDTVLVHSNLSQIGMIKGKSKEELLHTYLDTFLNILGDDGTVCVPAYFYEYARFQTPYDIKLSPVSRELGIFASYVTAREGSFRSRNPVAAIAAFGQKAAHICGGENFFSYGIDSPWEKLYQMNAKMLFIGIDYKPMTFIHYVEYRVGVPHMYNKVYNVPVLCNGVKLTDFVTSYVRYLKYGIEIDGSRRTSDFSQAGLERKTQCGNGNIYIAEMQQVFDFYKEKLIKNPYFMLKNIPQFIAGEIPYDGATGPLKTNR